MKADVWRVVQATAVGTSHLNDEIPCQDIAQHQIVDTSEDVIFVAVVCDGAGSATQSDRGAYLTARTTLGLIESYLSSGGAVSEIDRDKVLEWLVLIREIIDREARCSNQLVREFACTLLCAVVANNHAAFFQVGDGAIVVSDVADEWSYVFWPQHGEFANTTNFVVSPNALDALEFCPSANRIFEVAMFSDGLENLVLHAASKTAYASFFNSMLPPVRMSPGGYDETLSEKLKQYLLSPKVCDRTDDDKALILASRRQAQIVEASVKDPAIDP